MCEGEAICYEVDPVYAALRENYVSSAGCVLRVGYNSNFPKSEYVIPGSFFLRILVSVGKLGRYRYARGEL